MRGVEFKRFIEKHGIKKQGDISGSSEQTEVNTSSVQNDTVQEVSINV